jgi:hypothetical protein
MIESGTRVIHAQLDDPVTYLGDHDDYDPRRTFTLEIGARGTGVRCSSSTVAPADAVTVPDKSDRVTAAKVPTTRHHGPAMVWAAALDGETVARNGRTRRDAVGEALRVLAIREWHARDLDSTNGQEVTQ